MDSKNDTPRRVLGRVPDLTGGIPAVDRTSPGLPEDASGIDDSELHAKWLEFKERLADSGGRLSDAELEGLAGALVDAAHTRRAIAHLAGEILTLQERLVTVTMDDVELPSAIAHQSTAEGLLTIVADSLMSAIAELADDGGGAGEAGGIALPVEGNIG